MSKELIIICWCEMVDDCVEVRKLLCEDELLVCLRDSKFNVRFQNEICKATCEIKVGSKCSLYCHKIVPGEINVSSIKRMRFGDTVFNVTVTSIHDSVITLGTPIPPGLEEIYKICESHKLSERETTIVLQMAGDKTNRLIAKNLGITIATLKSHINNIYKKLGPDKVLIKRSS